jgi:hypothetical protein
MGTTTTPSSFVAAEDEDDEDDVDDVEKNKLRSK